MKQIYFALILFTMFLYLFTPQAYAENINSQKTLSLESIEKQAIIYGEGDRKVYVFIDPKCPHSRDFISMLNDNISMRGIYTYYIFFYELKRFNSHDLIATIYSSSAPLQRMLEVMVGGKEIALNHQIDPKIEAKIDTIAHIADEIGVSKRPYLIITKKLD